MIAKHYNKGDKVTIELVKTGSKLVTIENFYFSYIRNEWIYKVKELKKNIAHSDIWN